MVAEDYEAIFLDRHSFRLPIDIHRSKSMYFPKSNLLVLRTPTTQYANITMPGFTAIRTLPKVKQINSQRNNFKLLLI